MAKVESMVTCPDGITFCLDQENTMKLLSNSLKRKAWKTEVQTACGPAAVPNLETSTPKVTVEEPSDN